MIWFGINHFQITQIEVEIYLLGICTTQVRPTRRQIKNLFTNSIVENVLFDLAQRRLSRVRFQKLIRFHFVDFNLLFEKIILGTSKWDETCWLQYPEGRKFMTFTTES